MPKFCGADGIVRELDTEKVHVSAMKIEIKEDEAAAEAAEELAEAPASEDAAE